MKVHLKVVEGRPLGAEIPLARNGLLIGRDPTCHIRPKDRSVGPRHCQIALRGDHLVVLDLGSESGTLLNGRRVEPEEPARAYHGDQLKVGPLVFEVAFGHGQATATMEEEDASPASALANRLLQRAMTDGVSPTRAVGSLLHVKMEDNVPVVAIEAPRVAGDPVLLPLRRQLRDLAERPALRKVVMDFHHVRSITSEGVEILIAFHDRLQARGAGLKLCNAEPVVLRALEEGGLTDRAPVCLDCHDAVWSPW